MLPQEEQVVIKKQAQELCNLEFQLDTYWKWIIPTFADGSGNLRLVHNVPPLDYDWQSEDCCIIAPAPNVAELAIILPWMVNTSSIYTLMIWRCGVGWGVDYFNDLNRPLINRWAGENLAKTMGDRLIWLAKEKILIPSEVRL